MTKESEQGDIDGATLDVIKSAAPFLLTQAARLQAAIFRGRTLHLEATPAASYILYELTRQEPLTPKDLTERLNLGAAAIGQTLTRMERDGLVTRTRAPANRRWVEVRLTDTGRNLVPQQMDQAARLRNEIRIALGEDRSRRFEADLRILIAHYQSLAEAEGSMTYATATSASGTEV